MWWVVLVRGSGEWLLLLVILYWVTCEILYIDKMNCGVGSHLWSLYLLCGLSLCVEFANLL